MQQPLFQGVITAIVTPFLQDGRIDEAAFDALVKEQVEAGIHGIVIAGSTGEGATVEPEERIELVKRALAISNGRTAIIAGAGHNVTSKAVALQKQLQQVPIAGTLQVVPWYNKPTQEGLYQHFKAIAEAATVPVIAYNVPSRTVANIEPETVFRLAKDFPQITALKEANMALARLQILLAGLKSIRPDFSLLGGEDDSTLALLALGGHGVISVVSNIAPKETLALYQAYQKGDMATAQGLSYRLNELARLMFFRTNPIPVKTGVAYKMGKAPHFRLPLCPLETPDATYLLEQLRTQGWC